MLRHAKSYASCSQIFHSSVSDPFTLSYRSFALLFVPIDPGKVERGQRWNAELWHGQSTHVVWPPNLREIVFGTACEYLSRRRWYERARCVQNRVKRNHEKYGIRFWKAIFQFLFVASQVESQNNIDLTSYWPNHDQNMM